MAGVSYLIRVPAAHIDPETDQKSVYPVILILRPICDVSCYDVSRRSSPPQTVRWSAALALVIGIIAAWCGRSLLFCCGDLLCDGIRHGNFS